MCHSSSFENFPGSQTVRVNTEPSPRDRVSVRFVQEKSVYVSMSGTGSTRESETGDRKGLNYTTGSPGTPRK